MVVADISEESANQTLGSLNHDHKGQNHMASAVDVSSRESVEKLLTSIQVIDLCTYTHTHSLIQCVCVWVCLVSFSYYPKPHAGVSY